MAAGLVVVFDFDKTIIDCDSDNWVVDSLGFTERFDHLLLTHPWNSTMDIIMTEIHTQGISVQQIADILKTAPLDPHIATAIKSAYSLGCELKIVSDANKIYIETVLEHHGLAKYFSEINTNPSYIDEDGKLRIFPFHDFQVASHGCSLCPPNMCKSVIMKRIKGKAMKENKRIIYLGDGKGDYCPSLQLSKMDYLMPRKNYPLWDLICTTPSLIKAEIHDWSSGEEQERVLLQLIDHFLNQVQVTACLYVDGNERNMKLDSNISNKTEVTQC